MPSSSSKSETIPWDGLKWEQSHCEFELMRRGGKNLGADRPSSISSPSARCSPLLVLSPSPSAPSSRPSLAMGPGLALRPGNEHPALSAERKLQGPPGRAIFPNPPSGWVLVLNKALLAPTSFSSSSRLLPAPSFSCLLALPCGAAACATVDSFVGSWEV